MHVNTRDVYYNENASARFYVNVMLTLIFVQFIHHFFVILEKDK